jgi:hypothetical protein
VREVGVHLADELRARVGDGALQSVDVRPPEPALAGAVHDLDAARMIFRELIGDRARAVGRSVVHDQHAGPVVLQHAGGEHRQVFPFVIRRRYDQ